MSIFRYTQPKSKSLMSRQFPEWCSASRFPLGIAAFLWLFAVQAAAQQPPKPPTMLSLDGDVPTKVHDYTGLPLTADGWTDLHSLIMSDGYSDARIVYVSSSTGDDSTAQTYSPASSELSGTPLTPGAIQPFASYSAALTRLRPGYPDVLLFKRGDSFAGAFPNSGGRAPMERRIYAAYGSGSRPVFDHTGTSLLWNPAKYIVFADMEWTTRRHPDHPQHDPNHLGDVRVMYNAQDILFENILSRTVGLAINTERGSPPEGPFNIAFYRSVITNNYSTGGHQQGIYAQVFGDTRGYFLIDECVLDANGYYPDIAHATWFNRNLYISQVPNAIVRRSISARGASGDQLRRGGLWEKNLTLKQAWALGVGHPESDNVPVDVTIRYNVALDSWNIGGGLQPTGGAQAPHAMGYILGHRVATADVYENIVAHQVSGTGNFFGFQITSDMLSDVSLRDNIVYRWNGPALWINSEASGEGVVVTSNDFIANNGGLAANIASTSAVGVSFSDNTYYSSNLASPFSANGTDLSVAQWESLTGETAANLIPSYPDPERTITTYMQALGSTGLTYSQALDLFLERAKANEKGDWKDEYTALAVINYIRAGFGKTPIQ